MRALAAARSVGRCRRYSLCSGQRGAPHSDGKLGCFPATPPFGIFSPVHPADGGSITRHTKQEDKSMHTTIIRGGLIGLALSGFVAANSAAVAETLTYKVAL